MRLINTETLQLEDFSDDRAVRPYAILSHRWLDEGEVSFVDMSRPDRDTLKGWKKIRRCCKRAAESNLRYVWVDTCCIDRRSSAELSEAINSMYRWYENARVCYAYLADVRHTEDDDETWLQAFEKSEWFTRAWTLQELIAPAEIKFFDAHWKLLGRKVRRQWAAAEDDGNFLSQHIKSATGIPVEVLTGKISLDGFSIAQRMSWASNRKATKMEDVAYSLLGLFDVNMPMIYGEGMKAFTRLQEEIIRQSNDHTIFAWSGKDLDETVSAMPNSPNMDLEDFMTALSSISDKSSGPSTTRSLLAKSPEYFRDCRDMSKSPMLRKHEPYAITNLGLSISLPLVPWTMDHYQAILDCSSRDGLGGQVAIFLRQWPGTDSYVRVELEGEDIHYVKHKAPVRQQRRIYIRLMKSTTSSFAWSPRESTPTASNNSLYGFKIAPRSIFKRDEQSMEDLYTVYSHNQWSTDRRILEIPQGSSGTAGIIDISRQKLFVAAIKLGFDFDFNPVCIIADHTASSTLRERDWTTWTYSQDGSDDLAGKNIFQVNCMELKGWNVLEHRRAKVNPALLPGTWAFRGDSMLGLSFEIPSLRLSIEIKKVADNGQSIWRFDSEGLSARPRDVSPLPRSATA